MPNTTAIKTQGPGRPSGQLKRHVFEDLVRATEDALDRKTAREITVREICSAAGTSEAMIRYYFGGKEGLLLEIIKEFMDGSPHKDVDELSLACCEMDSIRPLVDRLCAFLYSRPGMIKMIAVELFSSSSELKEFFLRKYGRCVNLAVERVIDDLKAQGTYRNDLSSKFVSMSLMRLIVSPIMESAITGLPAVTPEVESGEWAVFIARTIDTISK